MGKYIHMDSQILLRGGNPGCTVVPNVTQWFNGQCAQLVNACSGGVVIEGISALDDLTDIVRSCELLEHLTIRLLGKINFRKKYSFQ